MLFPATWKRNLHHECLYAYKHLVLLFLMNVRYWIELLLYAPPLVRFWLSVCECVCSVPRHSKATFRLRLTAFHVGIKSAVRNNLLILVYPFHFRIQSTMAQTWLESYLNIDVENIVWYLFKMFRLKSKIWNWI